MGTQLNLNTDTVGDIKVALPKSQSDIYKIIEFLDHETTKIDHLIEKQQQLIELLKEKRQAVISHAVTKGLDPNVLMKDSGVEWLGKVPEHWAVSKLSYVAHGFNGDRGSNYPSGQDFVDEGIPFISSSELIHSKVDPVYASKITKEKYNSLGGLKIKVGDIIYCLRGSVGKNGLCEFNEGTIASSLMGIRCFSLSPYYLLLLLNSTVEFQQRSNFTTGSVSANLSAENVMSYKFALPPIKEQIEIANNLKKVFEKYDKLILKAESAIQLMQERRTALISAAVTGKIDVRNWQAPTVGAHTELSA
ncbi:type I restriction modification DNA specificity domain protein [Acinetobacter baumannii 1419130]|nr:restriction endonuclease subunit S [Acinetobacter baumannii]EXB30080.1 type I restriction modification DNA specificity domain protein [Acinetobacter baumannii 1419130]